MASRIVTVVTLAIALGAQAAPAAEEEQAPDVIAALVGAGARIYSVTRAARPLEEAYIELVREEAEA